MNKEEYAVYCNRWSYNSSSNEKYVGTIDELKKIRDLSYILQNKNPRTLNGLQRILNQYAEQHTTYYTGIAFEVFRN